MTRGVGRGEGVASSSEARRASTPSPRAVSSASATVFTPGVMEPKAPFDAHARALASHACLRGDDVDSGDSANPAFRGPSGVKSKDDAFAGAARGHSSGVACMARESLLRECTTIPTGAFENASTPNSQLSRPPSSRRTRHNVRRPGPFGDPDPRSSLGRARGGVQGLFVALRCAWSLPRPSSRRACVASNSTDRRDQSSGTPPDPRWRDVQAKSPEDAITPLRPRLATRGGVIPPPAD